VRPIENAAPRPTERVAPSAPVRAALDDDTGTAMISVRFNTQMLARVDAASKRLDEPRLQGDDGSPNVRKIF
jgi:hypothetical protein